jgi:uncharacterized protein
LRALPSLISLGLGLLSQIYLARVLRVRPALNWSLIALEILLRVVTEDSVYPLFERVLPSGYGAAFISGALILWSWALIPAAVVVWLTNKLPKPRFQPERRAWLKFSGAVVCAAPVAALSVGIVTRKNVEVKEIDLKFPNLPKDLRGLRLLQISDIHMGDFYSARDLARVVSASNDLRPDLAFVTGDLITTAFDPLDSCLAELARLRASSGVWGCLGNHEQQAKVEDYTTAKALTFGLRFLRHQSAPLTFGQSRINLVGVDHQRRSLPYLVGAEDLTAAGAFNLLLSHNPDVFPVAARKGFQLTLAGHTHGGQINLPIFGANVNPADLVTPYTKGFYKLPDASLYVNAGLGTIGVPVRLGAPPEITLIRLCDSSS